MRPDLLVVGGPGRSGAVDRALLAASTCILLTSAFLSPDLLRTLVLAASGLLVVYVVLRPSLAARGVAWVDAHRRGAGIAAAAIGVLGLALGAGELARHPAVGPADEARLWTNANLALARVAAADLRWQTAPAGGRAAAVADVARATRGFAVAVNDLERVRPPGDGAAPHAAAVAVYRELADAVSGLPAALARGDADEAAAIWRRAGLLANRATALVRLASTSGARE